MRRFVPAALAVAMLAGCATSEPRYVYDDGRGDYYYGEAAYGTYGGGAYAGYHSGFYGPNYAFYDAYYSPWGYRYWDPYYTWDYVIDTRPHHVRREGDARRDAAAVAALQTQRGPGPGVAPRGPVTASQMGPWRRDAYAAPGAERVGPVRAARVDRDVTRAVNRLPSSDTFGNRRPAGDYTPVRSSVGMPSRAASPMPVSAPVHVNNPTTRSADSQR